MGWSAKDIPDQTGRVAVVTGANSGIGFHTACELARRGARVLLACRSERRGQEAATRMRAEAPGARVAFRRLDLGDLASVRAFAADLCDEDRLDLLINNANTRAARSASVEGGGGRRAGVMALPYARTADGFETQFGVNHLGHFALTGLLLPKLLATPDARVVTVSSGMHALANIDPGDLNSERRYRRWIAYGRSKTANLLFVHELARLLAAAGSPLVVAASHPGYADTNLQTAGPAMEGRRLAARLAKAANRVVAQPPSGGALPTLYAATAPGVAPDDFYGPHWPGLRGSPAKSWRASWTLNDAAAERLWAASEQLTGVRYEGLGAASA
ncbi:SDR family NAD(P)-dependent oxidoreductase [Streptomyces sp. PTM05]|uniref:SDR family NAD(P)-dependent oxidoreductase n=1 Tax=Streptantibioticus parmotrematis TaxID=2873249 RepID=A0ABS7QZY3_9ACTN|nr:SDR family NAD(P)-dependent oxidoreductase [Streptantibioticus parmotrematis]MBY8887865.1 SDR family NAD(P)-dependent oxidoreductase [Streptantibioticus parmotrematis]